MNAAQHFRIAERLLAESLKLADQLGIARGDIEAVQGRAHVHATLAVVAALAPSVAQDHQPVEATIYCGHDGCGLPDGHLSEHSAGPRAGRSWNDAAGDALTVDDGVGNNQTPHIGVWLMDKHGGPAEMVLLTAAQAREVADDLRARADQLDADTAARS